MWESQGTSESQGITGDFPEGLSKYCLSLSSYGPVVCPISCNLSSLRPPRCVLENGKSSWLSVMCACSPYTRWWAVVGVSCHLHAGILYSDATLEFLKESVKLCGSGELCCLCANPND